MGAARKSKTKGTAMNTYTMHWNDGSETIEAADLDGAEEQLRNWIARYSIPGESTFWEDGEIRDMAGETLRRVTIAIDPDEPDCVRGHAHDWRSPYSVLGGLRENPGVHGHGGGVIIREVCQHCAAYRSTDTWAQRGDTGEQGLTSIHYAAADEASEAWAERHRPIRAQRFGGDYLDDESLRGYGLGVDDVGKFAVIEYGAACLGVGETADEAIEAAKNVCDDLEVVTDRRADDGECEVLEIEAAD